MSRDVVYTVYTFDELSEDAKKKAVEKARQNEYEDFSWQSECITEIFDEKLKELGYPHGQGHGKSRRERDASGTVEWSLSNCQGDGVAFYGPIDLDIVSKRLLKQEDLARFNKLLGVIRGPWDGEFELHIIRNSYGYHYSHHNTMHIEEDRSWSCLDDTDVSASGFKTLAEVNEFLDDFIKDVASDIRSTSKDLAKIGYDEIDGFMSDENITELIQANEWEFEANGKFSCRP
jgi:hypothetical protein